MKSNCTAWLEQELKKKFKELQKFKEYQDFVKLKNALDYSKMLDERKNQNDTNTT